MRHHVLRLAGLGVAVVLAICLGAVVVAMTGGPQAPLTQWAAPRPPAGAPSGHAARQGAVHATASARGQAGSAAPVSSTPSTRPVPSASAGTSATPTASLPPTNPAGQTPPGQTKSPNPHKPSVAA